jgi:hypothetical protein
LRVGRKKIWQSGLFFSALFFSFPSPPRRVEKNRTSKRDGTEIQMEIDYYKRPGFDSRHGGLAETKSSPQTYVTHSPITKFVSHLDTKKETNTFDSCGWQPKKSSLKLVITINKFPFSYETYSSSNQIFFISTSRMQSFVCIESDSLRLHCYPTSND